MNTPIQARTRLAQVAKRIDGIPIAMLTNVEADGALASRSMAVLKPDADGALWFFTDLRSARVEHLRAVNLSFTDTPHGTYVSLSGRGEIDTDRGRIQRLWTSFAKPWVPDSPDSSNLALLKFVPDTADCWDAPNMKMVRDFGALAPVQFDAPDAMADHGLHVGLSASADATGVRS